MGALMMTNFVIVGVNVVLLSALLILYARMLRQAPTWFTWGLLLFAGALWVQNTVQLFFFATMMDLYAAGLEEVVLIQNVLALVASAFLLGVTVAPTGVGRTSTEA